MSFRLTLVADERRILLTPTALCVQHCYLPGQTRPTDATNRWTEIDEWTERKINGWIDRQTQAILSCTLRQTNICTIFIWCYCHSTIYGYAWLHDICCCDSPEHGRRGPHLVPECLPASPFPRPPTAHPAPQWQPSLLVPRFANLGTRSWISWGCSSQHQAD